ncbi:MAG: hypothetical protein GX620_05800 [Chloroflexi bacterium]|nr:hypothetical protein [Chloroflexota bacterium]
MLDKEGFRSPSREYQTVCLWGWTDRMQDEELIRQVDDIHSHGWGGFFMAARVGLETPFLSKEWMDRTASVVAEAKQRGMKAWLYDEDGWPSCFAGGLATTGRADYRMKALVCREHGQVLDYAESVRVFVARRENGELQNATALTGAAPDPEPGLVFLHFYEWTQDTSFESPTWRWHSWSKGRGAPLLDVLNPRAVRRFIDVAYESYCDRFGDEFGSTIPGSFTDEPGMGYPGNVGIRCFVPWTPGFPAYFSARTGYSIIDHLPSLFYNVGDYRRVRYDFWRAMTSLFVESYTKQIGDWCTAHSLALTGHYLAEETLVGQLPHNGAVMPHYEYEGYVGIEKLGEDVHGVNWPYHDRLTIKQADSVACQLSKPRLLAETGLARHQAPVEARKWVADWMYVLGVNLLESGIYDYSVRGDRKRDWSLRHSSHQPWWRWNSLTEEYFSRLGYALTRGQRVVDVLVIHPISSAWVAYCPQGTYEVEELDHALDDLMLGLLQAHRDFHFGDEMIMERHARVENEKLWIGSMAYRVVVVPPAITLSASTVRLLRRFAEQGGTVIACEPLPTLVEGRAVTKGWQGVLPPGTRVVASRAPVSSALHDQRVLAADSYTYTVDLAELESELDRAVPADVSADGAPWVWYHHRHTEDDGAVQHIYFLANTSPDTTWSGTVRLRGEGAVEEWSPHTGEVTPLACRVSEGCTEVELSFPEAGSHLLVMRPDREPQVAEKPVALVNTREVKLGCEWQAERIYRPNALTLEYARYRVGDSPWSVREPLWQIYEAMRSTRMEADFEIEYAFEVGEMPSGPVYLAVECPTWWKVFVNGQPVAHEQGERWFDVSFRKVEITPLLKEKGNIVRMAGRFGRGSEIESCYILGDFGVEMPSLRIVREPCTVTCGDLVAQGYPFFSGIVGLRQEVELPSQDGRAFLVLDGLQATMAFVRVNNQDAGPVAFHPHEIEVTELLRAGRNEIEVQLVGSVQNLLGPHHYQGGEPYFNLPIGELWASQTHWTDAYECAALGLGGAHIVWRDSETNLR